MPYISVMSRGKRTERRVAKYTRRADLWRGYVWRQLVRVKCQEICRYFAGRRCVCTSKACKEAGVDTCRTKFYCYTELILTGDQELGANTTTRGCTKFVFQLSTEIYYGQKYKHWSSNDENWRFRDPLDCGFLFRWVGQKGTALFLFCASERTNFSRETNTLLIYWPLYLPFATFQIPRSFSTKKGFQDWFDILVDNEI